MYGISGTALSWFSSYLTNRTLSLIVDDKVSQVSSFPLVCHKVLCWAHFSWSSTENLFLTWFSVILLSLNVFVDDTQLQVSVPPSSIQSAVSSLETCLWDIQTWILENKLKLNNDKTEALLLRSASKCFSVSKPTTISFCGCEMSFSSSARFFLIFFYTSEVTWVWNCT